MFPKQDFHDLVYLPKIRSSTGERDSSTNLIGSWVNFVKTNPESSGSTATRLGPAYYTIENSYGESFVQDNGGFHDGLYYAEIKANISTDEPASGLHHIHAGLKIHEWNNIGSTTKVETHFYPKVWVDYRRGFIILPIVFEVYSRNTLLTIRMETNDEVVPTEVFVVKAGSVNVYEEDAFALKYLPDDEEGRLDTDAFTMELTTSFGGAESTYATDYTNITYNGTGTFDNADAIARSYNVEDIPSHRRGIFRKYLSYYSTAFEDTNSEFTRLFDSGMLFDNIRTYNQKGGSTSQTTLSTNTVESTGGVTGYMSSYIFRLGNTYPDNTVDYNLDTYLPPVRKNMSRYLMSYQSFTLPWNASSLNFTVSDSGVLGWSSVDSRFRVEDKRPSSMLLTCEQPAEDEWDVSASYEVLVTWVIDGVTYQMIMNRQQPSCLVTLDSSSDTDFNLRNLDSSLKMLEGTRFSAVLLP